MQFESALKTLEDKLHANLQEQQKLDDHLKVLKNTQQQYEKERQVLKDQQHKEKTQPMIDIENSRFESFRGEKIVKALREFLDDKEIMKKSDVTKTRVILDGISKKFADLDNAFYQTSGTLRPELQAHVYRKLSDAQRQMFAILKRDTGPEEKTGSIEKVIDDFSCQMQALTVNLPGQILAQIGIIASTLASIILWPIMPFYGIGHFVQDSLQDSPRAYGRAMAHGFFGLTTGAVLGWMMAPKIIFDSLNQTYQDRLATGKFAARVSNALKQISTDLPVFQKGFRFFDASEKQMGNSRISPPSSPILSSSMSDLESIDISATP